MNLATPVLGSPSSTLLTPEQLYSNRLYSIGRFLWVRKTYSRIQQIKQCLSRFFSANVVSFPDLSMFAGFDVENCIEELKEKAVSFGLTLPSESVEQIYQYACQTFCTEPKYNHRFWIEQINNGYLPDGHLVVRALVNEPANCPAIQNLIKDPILLQIVQRYLHYRPNRITAHLTWSIASNLPECEQRKLYPPTNYHYDIAGYNFMTVYFYITPVLDGNSGPHVMIQNSHGAKHLIFLLSGCHSDERVYRYYNRSQELTITGDAGFGFVQDPSCIHKVKPPVTNHRLLLQLRYS